MRLIKRICPFLLLVYVFFACASKVQKPIVVFTFDDAELSHYKNVAPLLKEYGFDATFFVCEYAKRKNNTTTYHMNWKQIKELNDMGFEIGNHTGHHKNVTKLSREDLVKEVQYIENKCAEYDIPRPISFAYSGNRHNEYAVSVLDSLGYRFGRAGNSRLFDKENDQLLVIPSYPMGSNEKLGTRTMKAMENLKDGDIIAFCIHGVPDIEQPDYSTSIEYFEDDEREWI